MKFEAGQIVKYEVEMGAWIFIVVDIHPNAAHWYGPYYSLYCIKSPNNEIKHTDLHKLLNLQEDLLNAV
jgi:hypothetical protein